MPKPELTIEALCQEAHKFADVESEFSEPSIYGVTDGKAIGTYLEHKFRNYLGLKYQFIKGNSAEGIDFPALGVDIKVTSAKQPQSSCPFKSARQKVYGLGYSLLVFVYEKTDEPQSHSARLQIIHTLYIDTGRTADFQTTTGIRKITENHGNADDLVAFFEDRHLPLDEVQARELADEILQNPPHIGYLTISNALQWRLQYGRVITEAGSVDGIKRIR